MRLSAALGRLGQLPFSLFIASVALAVAAVPVESAELTVLNPDNFKETVAKGVWFIEHFSPYCGHCRAFAPTWTKLVEEIEESSDPGIHLAQVNCAVNGDLCQENGVDGYPQLNLYRDGQLVETYRKARSYELLKEYIAKHAEPLTASTSLLEPVTPTDVASTSTTAHPDLSRKAANPRGSVLSLDGKTFQDAIKQGPIFVKFYAPWCGHCKKLAPIWVDLARHMQNRLTIAEVNCEDHSSLCKSQDVQGFPMLYYYSGAGTTKTEYTGGRKFEQLKAFADKANAPVVQDIKYEALKDTAREHPVFYLLLHSPTDSRILDEVAQAASVLLGSPSVFTSTSPEFFAHFSISDASSPVLLALKDHDVSSAFASFHPTSRSRDIRAMQQWFLSNRLPTSMELSADTFQAVMNAPHKPLVVLVAVPDVTDEKVQSQIKQIGREWRNRQGGGADNGVVFTWMDATKWASWLKSMYGIRVDDGKPSAVIADHQQLLYYDTDQQGQRIKLISSSVFSAIDGALEGTVKAKHSENIVERLARYLNNKMTSVESYVAHNPWHTFFFSLVILFAIFIGIRRVLSDDHIDGRELRNSAVHWQKSSRLD